MSQIIPTRSDLPFFDLQTELEGVTYTLQFRWNVRASRWFLDVLDAEGAKVLVASVKLVADYPLAIYRSDRQPRGCFFAADTGGGGVDPGINDLGKRVQLYYLTAAELGITT
jgi:hypothetical protein